MKTTLLTIVLIIGIATNAQEPFKMHTITSKGRNSVGGYGTITNEVTAIAGKYRYNLGGYGGVLLNHRLLFGGLGKVVFTDNINTPSTFVYFGPYTEYLIHPENLVHFSIGAMGGMGV